MPGLFSLNFSTQRHGIQPHPHPQTQPPSVVLDPSVKPNSALNSSASAANKKVVRRSTGAPGTSQGHEFKLTPEALKAIANHKAQAKSPPQQPGSPPPKRRKL